MCSSGAACRCSAGPDDGDESAVEHWTEREIDKTAFKDARLGQRFSELLKQIGDGMGESIPFACQDWANTKAAYRFFANERVEEANISTARRGFLARVALSFLLRCRRRGQSRGRVCLKWNPLGANRLATARTSRSHVSSAIFWASTTSPIGRVPVGKKHRSRRRPLSSISHTFTEAPTWILYRCPLSFPTTSK